MSTKLFVEFRGTIAQMGEQMTVVKVNTRPGLPAVNMCVEPKDVTRIAEVFGEGPNAEMRTAICVTG